MKRNRELQCGFTLYGWNGDTQAWESKIADEDGFGARTTHYVYEPGSFVPVAQAVHEEAIELLDQPEYGDYYRQDEDAPWLPPPAPAIDSLAWYRCDHLGTPQELTDEPSEIVWSAEYRACGVAQKAIRNASGKTPIANSIRFQGRYHDHETGLRYNRYRHYDPYGARYVTKDLLGFAGGLNLYLHAGGNPLTSLDPLGLDTVVIRGRGILSNPFCHVAIGFTSHGVYSFGTGTRQGSRATDYLANQEEIERYTGKPLPDHTKKSRHSRPRHMRNKNSNALEAGGITSIYAPYTSPFPTEIRVIARRNQISIIDILTGPGVPDDMFIFNK